jgi:cytoplasmic iron level regulating protein YaaA (DUF328/UPF0246 family)
MISVLSPAKSLDFDKEVNFDKTTVRFKNETEKLVSILKEKESEDLQDLMSISEKLANLNVDRYQDFEKNVKSNSKQAIFAFQGDVYQGFEADSLNKTDIDFAQDHVRILSGLYGLLRPLDMIQPYRLEMGTQLKVDNAESLYDFWDDKITNLLLEDLKHQKDQTIVNLASNEYFKSLNKKLLRANASILDVEFKDLKNDQYKIISFYAKKARGLMARYIVQNQITSTEDLKGFNLDGYWYDEKASNDKKLAFKRN